MKKEFFEMKNIVTEIGSVLLDVCIFILCAILMAALAVILACFIIVLIALVLPIGALYYAMKNEDTLCRTYTHLFEYICDGIREILDTFIKRKES